MGGSNMQRASSSTLRMAMVLCLVALVLLTFLYLSKRVENNKTYRELELSKLENKNMEDKMIDDLGKITERSRRLTQELASAKADLDKAQQMKTDADAQLLNLNSHMESCQKEVQSIKDQLNVELDKSHKAQLDKDNAIQSMNDLQSRNEDLQNQLTDLNKELDECELKKEDIQDELNTLRSDTEKGTTCAATLNKIQQELNSAKLQVSKLTEKLQQANKENKGFQYQAQHQLSARTPKPPIDSVPPRFGNLQQNPQDGGPNGDMMDDQSRHKPPGPEELGEEELATNKSEEEKLLSYSRV